jgi:hypothetical protein
LAVGFRFYDKSLSFSSLPIIVVFFELLIIIGKHPGIGEEVILLREPFLEGHETVA